MKDNALYLEVDEDITSAIDKLNKASGSSVQIVVPKRSTLLQSVINQKLLKKAADNAKKKLVIVTNDRIATDLAARVGIAVAASVGAEAVLTKVKDAVPVLADDVIEDGDPAPAGPPPEPVKPSEVEPTAPAVEPLSKASKKAAPMMATRALSDDEPKAAAASRGGKSPKVPNFSKLRKRAIWLAAIILVIVGYSLYMYFGSSGTATLYADGARSDINATFAVDTSLDSTDTSSTTIAGDTVTTSHNLSTTFNATGSQNIGTKASGNMTVNNSSGVAQPLVAGTRFVAPDGNVFLSDNSITVPGATVSVHGTIQPGTATVGVTASQSGDNYNEAGGQTYSIPGLGSQTLVTAQGGQMSGGTSKTVQIVQQSDVNNAVASAVAGDKASGQKALLAKVPKGEMGLTSSLTATPADITSNPAVGGQGSQASLTLTINYSMLIVNKQDFTAVIENIERQQLGSGNQIYDNGLGNADISSVSTSGTKQTFRIVTTASGGPSFNRTAIANALRGKKYSDASDYVSGLPGVVKATVSLSPAWATSMPRIANHIHVKITVSQD